MKKSYGTKHLFAAALAISVMTATASWAQSTTSNATATGSGVATSGALASSKNSYKNSNKISNSNSNSNSSQSSSGSTLGVGPATTINQGSDLGKNVPTVYAPALAAAGYEVCLGSVSAGASGSGFGLSFGGTYEDKGCQARLNAKTLATLGYVVAGREVLCQDPSIRAAMHNAGTPCAGDDGRFAAAAQCRDDFDLFNGWQRVCGP